MRVEQVKIEQFKAIENFEFNFEGKHVLLIGENAIGKSTIMQFIRIALGDQTVIPPHAEGEGYVVANKNGEKFTFEVRFREGKPVVTIISQDGLKDKSKGYLSQICGAMDFNIDEFVKKSESVKGRKEQIEDFKKLLPADTQDQLRRFENHIKAIYEERHELNKDIKNLEAKIKLHRLYKMTPRLEHYKEVKLDELLKEKEEIRAKLNAKAKENRAYNEKLRKEHQESIDKEKSHVEHFNLTQKNISESYDCILLWIDNLEEKGYNGSDLYEWLKTVPTPKVNKVFSEDNITPLKLIEEMPDDSELKAIDEKIVNAQVINKDFTDAQELKKMMKDLETHNNESGEMTAKMESEQQCIQNTIKQMDSPVEGLFYDDDGLIYNGIPVHPASLSTSEIMTLGYKLKVSENPESPLFLEGLESMGHDKYTALIEFANANNVQIIGEQVMRDQKELKIELFK
jgi:hypothetical protein